MTATHGPLSATAPWLRGTDMITPLMRRWAQWQLSLRLHWRGRVAADAAAVEQLVASLSRPDRRFRFHAAVKACPSGLAGLGFVAVRAAGPGQQVLAEARMALDPAHQSAELALMVDAAWRQRGIGQWCLQRLCREAQRRGVQQLRAAVLADNRSMQRLLLRNGFQPLLPGDAGEIDADGACWLVRAP